MILQFIMRKNLSRWVTIFALVRVTTWIGLDTPPGATSMASVSVRRREDTLG